MIVELERRNPHFACPRITLIIARTFDIEIDKFEISMHSKRQRDYRFARHR